MDFSSFLLQKGLKMDLNGIQQAISTFGFPIACVIFLALFIWKIRNQQHDQNQSREEKLYEYLGKANVLNEQLTKTNSDFVQVLNAYNTDIEQIKHDVTEIKTNMKD